MAQGVKEKMVVNSNMIQKKNIMKKIKQRKHCLRKKKTIKALRQKYMIYRSKLKELTNHLMM